MKNRRVQFDAQAWMQTHMARLAPAHKWQPLWALRGVEHSGFLCTNCMAEAQVGDTIQLPCRGVAA